MDGIEIPETTAPKPERRSLQNALAKQAHKKGMRMPASKERSGSLDKKFNESKKPVESRASTRGSADTSLSDDQTNHKYSEDPVSTKNPRAWNVKSMEARRERNRSKSMEARERQEFKQTLRDLLDDPSSSKLALVFALVTTAMIVMSIITFAFETVDQRFGCKFERISKLLEWFFNIIFTLEMMARIYVGKRKELATDILLFFDLLAVIPFWLELSLDGTSAGRLHSPQRFVVDAGVENNEKYYLEKSGGEPLTEYCIDMHLLDAAFDGWNQTKYSSWDSWNESEKEMSTMMIISRTAVSICKAFRCLRLLKLARQYDDSIVLVRALHKSAKAMNPPFFFLAVIVTLMASVCYYGELIAMGSEDKMAFSHIPHAMWFMLVTMTTVGYGDVTPNSTFGQLLSIFAMFFGVIFLSMPLAIVGDNFTATWADREKVIFVEKMKEIYHKRRILTVEDMCNEFDIIEKEYEGELSFPEFREHVVDDLKMEVEPTHLKRVFHAIDEDGSGTISFYEFITLFFSESDTIETEAIEQETETRARRATRAGSIDVRTARAAASSITDNNGQDEQHVDIESAAPRMSSKPSTLAVSKDSGNLNRTASLRGMLSERKASARSMQKHIMKHDEIDEVDEAPKTRHSRRGSIMHGAHVYRPSAGVTKEQVEVIMETQKLILEQLSVINHRLGIHDADTSPLARRVSYSLEKSQFFDNEEEEL